MGSETGIAWTDSTWNPCYGCFPVSEGCRYCYAEQVVAGLARKLKGEAGAFYASLVRDTASGPRWTGQVKIHHGHLLHPLRWREPRLVFVNSLSDIFHESLAAKDIATVFAVMAMAERHTFQVLTKRPERMRELLSRPEWPYLVQDAACGLYDANGNKWSPSDQTLDALGDPKAWPLRNVWIGVSVEDQKAADTRIPLLLQTPAAVRWLSCEPLLGPVKLDRWIWGDRCPDPRCGDSTWDHDCQLGAQFLHWVIAGGESGSGAREMRQEWADSLQEQCARAGVPFFFKQHSAFRSGTLFADRLPGGVLVREFPKGVRRG